jgi:hypothetical protein
MVHLFAKLTNIFVRKLMTQSNPLRLVFYGFAIDYSMPELLHDRFVDSITLDPFSTRPNRKRGPRVWPLTKSSTVHLLERSTTGCV